MKDTLLLTLVVGKMKPDTEIQRRQLSQLVVESHQSHLVSKEVAQNLSSSQLYHTASTSSQDVCGTGWVELG
jgi:hypothetical protein